MRYRYPFPVLPAVLLDRPNRFLVQVRLGEGRIEPAHLPNPGRLQELIHPGVHCHVVRVPAPLARHRKTTLTLINVERPGRPPGWVSVDTQLARPVVERALAEGRIPQLSRWGRWKSEVRWGRCRFDHGVPGGSGNPAPQALLEVKSSNLREGRTALFPDAPTARGAHHAEVLGRFARRGGKAAVLFLVQRSDASEFRPYGAMDPRFAHFLDRARSSGVILLAWDLRVLPDGIEWGKPLPVRPTQWVPGRDLTKGLKDPTPVTGGRQAP